MGKGGHPKSGPPAADAATRRIKGSRTRPRHRRREEVESVASGAPTKPRHLGRFGSAEWNRLVALLRSEQRLTASDRPALMVAATFYETSRQLEQACAKEAPGAENWVRLSRAARFAWSSYSKALGDLCLTPATRARAPHPKKTAASMTPSGGGGGTTKLLAWQQRNGRNK